MQRQRSRGVSLVGLGVVLVSVAWAFAATGVGAQADAAQVQRGAQIFQQTCAACHTIGGGTRVGPDLAGVTERRDPAWLRVQIQTPSVHQAQNDPISVANRQQFGIPMPNLGLSDQDVTAVMAYLAAGTPASTAIPALFFPTLGASVLAIAALTLIAFRVATKRVEVRP
ncbi:MAG: cytochrome c [Chloroflexi bacterium]|nr:cytochrome c [Chloroflexota bacterium]